MAFGRLALFYPQLFTRKIRLMLNKLTPIVVIGGSGFIGTRLARRLRGIGVVNFGIIDKAPSQAFPDLVTLSDVR